MGDLRVRERRGVELDGGSQLILEHQKRCDLAHGTLQMVGASPGTSERPSLSRHALLEPRRPRKQVPLLGSAVRSPRGLAVARRRPGVVAGHLQKCARGRRRGGGVRRAAGLARAYSSMLEPGARAVHHRQRDGVGSASPSGCRTCAPARRKGRGSAASRSPRPAPPRRAPRRSRLQLVRADRALRQRRGDQRDPLGDRAGPRGTGPVRRAGSARPRARFALAAARR